MSVNHIDFVDTRLTAPLKSSDLFMRVAPKRGLLEKLNRLPTGDHVYFVLRAQDIIEVVKYTHTAALATGITITLPIERAQHGTVATSFPYQACVGTELTKAFLDEWLAENKG